METLKQIPKIDKIALNPLFKKLNKKLITSIAQEEIANLREKIKDGKIHKIDEDEICHTILQKYHQATSPSLKPLINATGIILHTNLGRAPLHETVYDSAQNIACGYSNLEYDMDVGKRGERYTHVSKQLRRLLNAEDALIVNNNAAAVFLILNTFAKNKEVIVSRGELVEIGGSFRVPDVMEQSGCKLVEVGTTNKTKIQDYENAINQETTLLMKVHQSNFSMQGFTEETNHKDIVALANKHELIDFYDAGGAFMGNIPFELEDIKLNLSHLLSYNPSLVSFSGDKLLGGVQAGIIVGKKNLISKLKRNQLLRMLRVDKITLALLEATFTTYLTNKTEHIPVLTLLNTPLEKVRQKALNVAKICANKNIELVSSKTYVGGGTMPNKTMPTFALRIKGEPQKLQKAFRDKGVIGRIEEDSFLLDFRSIQSKETTPLANTMKGILCNTLS